MKILLRIGFCCTLGCMLAGGLMAQRGGGGHGGGGGIRGGGGTGGFRGGGGITTGGFRGGYGGIGYGRGSYGNYGYGYGRGLYRGYGYGSAVYGWGGGLGYYSPYLGYWDDPYYSTYSSGYAPPVEYNPSPNVTVIYPAAPQTQPAYEAPVRPMVRSYDQYGQKVEPSGPARPANGSPIYLIAMKDQTIRAAAAYWVDGRTLHYVTLQHEEKQAPLDSVDRSLSSQLNRERRVTFQLPQ